MRIGGMSSLFSDDEWARLKFLPFQAFTLVAGADGDVDHREVGAFMAQIERSALLLDPLHRELLVDLALEDHSPYMDAASPEGLIETTEVVIPFLRERLSEAQYKGFVRSLFIASLQVAQVSGGGPLHLDNKVSPKEAEALSVLSRLYDVDAEFLMA